MQEQKALQAAAELLAAEEMAKGGTSNNVNVVEVRKIGLLGS